VLATEDRQVPLAIVVKSTLQRSVVRSSPLKRRSTRSSPFPNVVGRFTGQLFLARRVRCPLLGFEGGPDHDSFCSSIRVDTNSNLILDGQDSL